MEIRVIKPFDAARALADLRIIYADKLHAGRSFAIAAVIVGVGGAVLLLAVSGLSGLDDLFQGVPGATSEGEGVHDRRC